MIEISKGALRARKHREVANVYEQIAVGSIDALVEFVCVPHDDNSKRLLKGVRVRGPSGLFRFRIHVLLVWKKPVRPRWAPGRMTSSSRAVRNFRVPSIHSGELGGKEGSFASMETTRTAGSDCASPAAKCSCVGQSRELKAALAAFWSTACDAGAK